MFAWLTPKPKPVAKLSDIARGYDSAPSITGYLPWQDYDAHHQLFLLADGKTVAAVFSIVPVACEARPAEQLQAISRAFAEALTNTIPCDKQRPWILQFFIQRNTNPDVFIEQLKNYVPAKQRDNALTQAHLQTLQQHFNYVFREEGIFTDRLVTNQTFRGGFLQVYAVLYRTPDYDGKAGDREQAIQDIQRTARKFADQLNACGITITRLSGTAFYHWLVRWFNPKPQQTAGDIEKLIAQLPALETLNKPYGWDLTENIFFNAPQSFDKGWLFDGLPHQVLTVQSLTTLPAIGHLTAERQRGIDDKVFTLVDHLPPGSVFSLHIVFTAQSNVELHLKTVHDSAVGHHALAQAVRESVENAEQAIAHGDLLLPTVMAVYVRGNDVMDLQEKTAHTEVLLNSNGFKVIHDDELFPIDAYLRYLPMCYDYQLDKKNSYRARYVLLSDIAKLLPLYGRSRGSGNPGFIAFNRGGEPWTYDILADRSKNAHALILGDTGTGKSNLLNYLLVHQLVLYRPRLFIIEAGGSFNLLGEYCRQHGLSVNQVTIDLRNPVSLNPFANGLQVLEQLAEMDKTVLIKATVHKLEKDRVENKQESATPDDDTDETLLSRDLLGEMTLAALVMITGGEKQEEQKLTRADRMLVMDAIIEAARFVKAENKMQMIASDLVSAFDRLATQLDRDIDRDKIQRCREMADGLRYFTRDPVSGAFFNTPGDPWPLADITIVNFGLFAHEGYEAQRAIAFTGCLNKMLALAEANQYSERPIIGVFDENHIFSKIPLLASMQTLIAKTGRKFGLWLWLATQNMRDFADEAHKMLSLMETWLCLALPPDEIDQIERFKPLTAEQRALFLSAKKSPRQYTEGVLLSPKVQGLFRNIPPRFYLALAATEQHEKNQRRQLMREHNISELEAVAWIAEQMMGNKVSGGKHE